jgi:molybdenum cofactor cytidylyltransferase
MIPILILAAGTSSRMRGADKMLEDVGGVPLLRRQAAIALETGQPIFVALGAQMALRQNTLRDLDVAVMTVPEAAEGLSGTLRGAIAQLPQCEAFMIMLGDLVALTTEDLQSVLDARGTYPDHLVWRGATEDRKPGHPILIDQSLRSAFAALQGDHGGESILRPLRDKTHLVRLKDQHARFDLDTPEDWAAWRAIYS